MAITILFPVIVLLETPFGIIPQDLGEVIVAYGGTILGGFLTLYGVWWTIESNKQQERKDKALQYRPLLQYDICSVEDKYQQCGEINFIFENSFFDNARPEYLELMIKLKNVGRGEIEKIAFELVRCELINASFDVEDSLSFFNGSYFLGNQYINFIPIDGEIYIYLGIPEIKEEYKDRIGERFNVMLKGQFDIRYKGLFDDITEYVQTLVFHLNVDYEDSKYAGRFYNTSLDLKMIDKEDNS